MKKRKHENPAAMKAALATIQDKPGAPWRPILTTCCEVMGITPGDLRRYNSSPYVSDRRHIAAVELYRAGYTSREVGAMLYRRDATVRTSMTQYLKFFRYDPVFQAMAMAVDAAVQALLAVKKKAL